MSDTMNTTINAPKTITYAEAKGICSGEVTAFHVDNAKLTASSKNFLFDMLNGSHANYMQNKPRNDLTPNTLEDWLQVAYVIHYVRKRHEGATCYKARVDGMRQSVIANYSSWHIDNGYGWNFYRSGVQHSSSLSQANHDIRQKLYEFYCKEKANHGNRNKKGWDWHDRSATHDFKGLTGHPDKDKKQDVFWGLVSMNRWTNTNDHKPRSGHGSALVAVFYDFKVSPVLPEDDGHTYIRKGSLSEEKTPINASNTVNDTPSEVTNTYETNTQSTITHTSEMSGSSTFEMGTSVTVTNSVGAEAFGVSASTEVSATVSFNAAINKGWSSSEGVSETTTTNNSTTITLPPYSAVLLKQSTTRDQQRTTYECPMVITYKVMLLDHILNASNDEADAGTWTLGIFGDAFRSAREDLKFHIVDEPNFKDEARDIRWDAMMKDGMTKDAMQYILKNTASLTPMARTDASYTVELKTVTTIYDGMISTKPLCRVNMLDTPTRKNMYIGETFEVEDIKLEGVNAWGYPYIGFSKEKGHWKLTYADGKDYYSGRVAALNKKPGGEVFLKAKAVGKVYLQYVIDENCYATHANPNLYMTNASLVSAPVIEVVIEDKFAK